MANNGSKVMACKCENKSQDALYGKGMRLHNYCSVNKVSSAGLRCTVCKDIKQSPGK